MHRSRTAAILGALVAMVLTLTLAACGTTTTASLEDTEEATPSAEPTESASAPPTEDDDGDDDDDGGDDDADDGGDTVSLSGGQFAPRSLTVSAGTTVTFTNTGGHTVTEGSNGTPADDPIVDATGGADVEVTFDEPGTYSITCRIHPSMNMTITVSG